MTQGPNLFLMAAPRAGSTQLAAWLTSHPDISGPGLKEPNHFSSGDFPETYVRETHLNDVDPSRLADPGFTPKGHFAVIRSADHYRALYTRCDTRWRLDASTSYLASADAIRRVSREYPAARIISLVREPLARSLSHYRLALRTGRTRASLGSELEQELSGHVPPGACYLLRPSRLTEATTRLEAAFGSNHLPLRFEAVFQDPGPALGRIAAFLDIDPDGFDLTRQCRNQAASPRFPALNAWLHRSGLKTRMRRAMPEVLKPACRAIAFRTGAAPIAPNDIDALRHHLRDEITAYRL